MLRLWLSALLLSCVFSSTAGASSWGGFEREDPLNALTPWRDWLVRIGPDQNSFVGGSNDPYNFFGTIQGEDDDYLGVWDVVEPPPAEHQLNLRFTGDEWGENPTYPPYNPYYETKGLCWDVRMPYASGYKIWRTEMVTEDPGYTYALLWNLDPMPGSGLAIPPNFTFRLDMDGSFADEPPGDDPRWFDLANYEIDLKPGHGGPEYTIEGLPQTGDIQVWYIIAGGETKPIGVPEPSAACLAPLVLGAAASLFSRRRSGR